MSVVIDTVHWLTNGDQWSGSRGIGHRLIEHAHYTAAACGAALMVALGPAAWLGHRRRFGRVAVAVANIGQTIPSFAILVLVVQAIGTGSKPVLGPFALFLAMAALAVPPIFTNTYTGVSEVTDVTRDAARGLGMSDWQQLVRVELPLAAPLVFTGIRIAAVQVISTATIGAYAGSGGLGRFIIDGFALQDDQQILGGAVLVAALAILVDRSLVGLSALLGGSGRGRRRIPRPLKQGLSVTQTG